MKKMLVMMLLFGMLAQTLIGCSSEGTSENISGQTDGSDAAQTTEVQPTETEITDDLPDDLDFEGADSHFLYRGEIVDEFYADTITGDIVNDTVYQSIENVEERLNVNITVNAMDGHMSAARQPYMNHIDNTILAGDDLYDWVDLMIGQAAIRLQSGLFMNILDNKYIDLTKPWYLAKMSDMVIADNLLFISGDASTGYLKDAFVIYFNRKVAENYGIDDPYAMVDEGKWTLDKVMETAVSVASDLDGDGTFGINDRLGFLVHNYNHLTGFLGSTGVNMYTENSDGVYEFTFGSERDINVCEKLYKLLYATDGSHDCNLSDTTESEVAEYNAFNSAFIGGRILMMTAQLSEAVAYLRDMEDPYGVLPYPKYDEEQENYITLSRSTQNSFSMPKICASPDKAGAVLEALSCEKYKAVLPAYFETAMKTKYSRDEESSRMFDLVRASVTLNFEFVYGQAIGNPALGVFRKCFSTENAVASTIAANEDMLDTKLAEYINIIEENYN